MDTITIEVPVVTEKLWGTEEDIVTNEGYTGKILHINPGFISSIHKHDIKLETFYIANGNVRLTFYEIPIDNMADYGIQPKETPQVLTPGMAVTIPVGQYHSFEALIPSDVYEFSTPHSDEDVTRYKASEKL
jgi:mannose-6-phosphate isomerase-like protein (cupin superfamily)